MGAGAFALIALVFALYGAGSKLLHRGLVTAPLFFTLAGIGLGPIGLGLINVDLTAETFLLLAEITLALVLFTDASHVRPRHLAIAHQVAGRLLLVALPLMVGLGMMAALWLFPGLPLFQALALAAIVSPTDAALGRPVISSGHLNPLWRDNLLAESGLNDGLVLPVVLVALLLSSREVAGAAADAGVAPLLWLVGGQVVLGPLVGAIVALSGGRLFSWALARGYARHMTVRPGLLMLGLLAWAGASAVGGNGFLAAFTAGLLLGSRQRALLPDLHPFAEMEADFLSHITFMLFGAVMVPAGLAGFMALDGAALGPVLSYVALSLLVVRLLAVGVALIGSGQGWRGWLFFGWMGPRGMASLVFVLMATAPQSSGFPPSDGMLEPVALPATGVLFPTVVMTVLASIALHGLSAYPLARFLSR
ncbi:cation:proton antiporter domain-containing protein [Yunchengibacter salinarum]|uniref:cation:proton antiporter domain-containing protein n=1 Tax=Yunchengibacter salinarum TaxID=3133399 RepID=UPI0035B5DCD2